MPGCQRLWAEGAKDEGQLGVDQAEASADVDAPVQFAGAFGAVPKQLTEPTPEGR